MNNCDDEDVVVDLTKLLLPTGAKALVVVVDDDAHNKTWTIPRIRAIVNKMFVPSSMYP